VRFPLSLRLPVVDIKRETEMQARSGMAVLLPMSLMLLVACGGGGGGGPTGPGPVPDPDPDPVPPSSPVVYLAAQDEAGVLNLYLADADDPGTSVQLNPALPAAGVIDSFALSPANDRVVYIADQDTAGQFELYSVEFTDPGTAVKLNADLVADADVVEFNISPDGSQVIYSADQDTLSVRELYLVDFAAPATSTKLNSPLVQNGDVSVEITFSPDGTQVLYAADQDTSGLFELYLVDPAVPGVTVKVNGPFPATTTLRTGALFSPDGSWILYGADPDTETVSELYVVATATPGTATKVNPPYSGDSDLCNWKFSPDSTRIVYCADEDTAGVLELYLVDIGALGVSAKLNPPLVSGGDVEAGFAFSADSSFLAYRADQDTDETRELYRVDLASPGVAEKVNSALPDFGGGVTGDVFAFRIRPDNLAITYSADQVTNGIIELFEVDVSDPGVSTKVNPDLAGSTAHPFEYSADGTRLVYAADQDTSGEAELYVVEVAALGAATKVSSPLVTGGTVQEFRIPR
jgi:Tol biopolymer transport system component